jgi:hypothetical protein
VGAARAPTLSLFTLCPSTHPRTTWRRKSAFTNAILAAERDGMNLEEIARITGFSISMIRAVLRSS